LNRLIILVILFSPYWVYSQHWSDTEDHTTTSWPWRTYDSIIASKIPVMKLPAEYRSRSLPVSVDNSQYIYFPGILDQYGYFNCQQYAGVAYTYAYEINRLLNKDGDLPENRYPPHYTWNFMNDGDRYKGVSFFYSFQVLKEQGHMTLDDYGGDTLLGTLGWKSGYDKYYRGMGNRIKAIYSIPTNTEEGVLTLKHYLNDHLNGSTTGGVACFSASSNFQGNFAKLPAGTPEAGKDVIIAFYPLATHGMTIVGYNDSIRYDLNGDGQFTNDLDINDDGIIDVRDWEIGAYRMANSYGSWWSDHGFCYILYRAMALKFDYPYSGWDPDRGIWNHSVYIVEPETGYQPLMTMKLKLTHNSREKIRIKAGISADTSRLFPEHVIEFPFLGFHGGDHVMQGFDAIPEDKTIEVGFDITPLLSYIGSGEAARFFLLVNEKDTAQSGEGFVNQCSFIDYTNGIHEMTVPQTNVTIDDNTLTILSLAGSVNFDKVHVTTENLPAYNASHPYQMQLAASGGKAPLQWSLVESYEMKRKDTLFPAVYQQRLYQDSPTIPYARFVLPFSFPFYGQKHDTLFINFYGFIGFDKEQLPYPYLTDEEGMLKRTKIICPAFYPNAYYSAAFYNVWVESHPGWVTIRWENGDTVNHDIHNNYALRLYPSGEFELLYGDFIPTEPGVITYSGYSKGDERNFDVWTNWNSSLLSNKSYRFRLHPIPSEISLTKEGLLNIAAADTNCIFEIPVNVTDANKISAGKSFCLSTGLTFSQGIVCGSDHLLKFGIPAHFMLSVRNDGVASLQNIQLKLVAGDSSIILSDSLFSIPSLAPGSVFETEKAFTFQMHNPLPDLSPIDFTIQAFTAAHHWYKTFSEPVSAPEILAGDPEIFDGYDGFLDPGEIADLLIPVRNLGSLYSDNLDIQISTSDPYVTILSQPVQTIDSLPAFSPTGLSFRIQALQNAPQAHNAEFLLTITDHQTINLIKPFTLKLGKVPVAIVCLSPNPVSASEMRLSLDSLQVSYEYLTKLPSRINNYSSLFISLGVSNGSHSLTLEESNKLAGYLLHGGKLYMESYATWYYQNKTSLHPYFKYSTHKVPVYSYDSIQGVTSSLTNSMYFNYVNTTNSALFTFIPQSPAFEIFTNTESIINSLQIAYDGDDYKTIGSIFEFGSLVDGETPSKKITLMRRYLDFFDVAISGPKALFHCSKNSVCCWQTVDFTDDSFDNVVSWQWEFPGGTPSLSTAQNPTIQYIDADNYDVKLTVSDGIHTRSITKKNFIYVNVCAGDPELINRSEMSVYPNPANSIIRIKFSGTLPPGSKLYIFDLMGRKVMERRFKKENIEGGISVDVSSLQKGLYIIKLISGTFNESAKVVIE
jgi:PKD repeat protein